MAEAPQLPEENGPGHTDLPHEDIGHGDTHFDIFHFDFGHDDFGHFDIVHFDTGHDDFGHQDLGHLDSGHEDLGHFDFGHTDLGHSDLFHGDAGHFDQFHVDHIDTAHLDFAHLDLIGGGVQAMSPGNELNILMNRMSEFFNSVGVQLQMRDQQIISAVNGQVISYTREMSRILIQFQDRINNLEQRLAEAEAKLRENG